jgi:hypothetical protein
MPQRLLFLIFSVILCTVMPASAQTGFHKILFLGNSITKHGPNATIDWSGDWGMAASAEEKDYVHLLTQGLAAKTGAGPEIMVRNIADFERASADYDIAGKLKDAIDFPADLIILAIGENVPLPKTPEDQAAFQSSVTKLLTAVKADRHPTLLVRSCFWANATKDEALKKACAEAGGVYVDIGALSKDEHNYARSERPFKNAGVAKHPGDQGMAAIATAILEALPKK